MKSILRGGTKRAMAKMATVRPIRVARKGLRGRVIRKIRMRLSKKVITAEMVSRSGREM